MDAAGDRDGRPYRMFASGDRDGRPYGMFASGAASGRFGGRSKRRPYGVGGELYKPL